MCHLCVAPGGSLCTLHSTICSGQTKHRCLPSARRPRRRPPMPRRVLRSPGSLATVAELLETVRGRSRSTSRRASSPPGTGTTIQRRPASLSLLLVCSARRARPCPRPTRRATRRPRAARRRHRATRGSSARSRRAARGSSAALSAVPLVTASVHVRVYAPCCRPPSPSCGSAARSSACLVKVPQPLRLLLLRDCH